MALTIACLQPPSPRPASAPADEFSAVLAWQATEGIARLPRPVGAPAHALARARIIETLRALGLEPETQRALSAIEVPAFGVISGAWIENIVARIPASTSRAAAEKNAPAILLAAHYDSVRNSPGASDDAAGVATLLETARALLAPGQAPRRHEVRLLFSDGEENALLGAHAFVDASPWARDIGLALNFEARGSGGPSAMYDTSAAPGPLIDLLARAPGIARYAANSFVPAVARALPNDTDFSVFRAGGMPGLSFAYAGRVEHYHSFIDDASHLDLGSLQQHGDAALALARAASTAARLPAGGEERVYFDVFGARLVSYSTGWAAVLVALSCLLYGFRARARGGLFGRRVWRDAGIYLLALAVTGLVLSALALGAGWLRPSLLILHAAAPLTLAYLAVGVGVFASLFTFFRMADARGIWLVHLIAATGIAVCAPAASHPFQWPLLAVLLSPGLSFIAAFFLSYVGYVFYIAVGSPLPFVICLPALAYVALTWPRLARIGNLETAAGIGQASRGWRLRARAPRKAFGLALIGGLGLAVTLAMARYTPDFPEPSFVAYASDRDQRGENYWVTSAAQKQGWLEPYRKAARPFLEVPWYSPFSAPRGEEIELSPGPALDLPSPELAVLGSTPYANGKRRVRFRLRSPRAARCLIFWVDEPGASGDSDPFEARVVSIDGQPLHQYIRISPLADKWLGGHFLHAPSRSDWILNFCAAPPTGAIFELETSLAGRLRLRYQDKSEGLPSLATQPERYPPTRPGNLMPSSGSDVVILSRSAEI